MIDEQQVRKIAQEEIQNNASRNQFGVSQIPAHHHDGVGSLPIDGNSLVFGNHYFVLPTLATTTGYLAKTGAVVVVGGVLKICTGTSVWVSVGSQT